MLGTELLNKQIHEKFDKNNFESLESPRHKIQKAINAFLFADFKSAHRHIKDYYNSETELISNLDQGTRLFCSTYVFLLRLIENRAGLMQHLPSDKIIYNLGESHCLSFAHRKIKIGRFDHIITPKITYGAKAFHFAKKRENAFTAITKANFNSLPYGSKVFLSFGEIDCRPNEGFIIAAAKLKRPIEDLISKTVIDFVKWFIEQNHHKQHKLFFFNVPAPIYNKKYSSEINEQVKSIIKFFNSKMLETISRYDLNIIDTYKFTVGNDGFSDGLHHIDGRHLSGDAISHIEKQLGS